MKIQNAFSKKTLLLAGAGLFLLSACMQGPDANDGGKKQAAKSMETPSSVAALTAMAKVKAAAGDPVADAQLAKLRALAEAGVTSGPEFDAAVAAIRSALDDQDVVTIDSVKRDDNVDAVLDPKVKADMDAIRALLEAGKSGPEVDALVEKLNGDAGGKDVIVIDGGARSDKVIETGETSGDTRIDGGTLVVIGRSDDAVCTKPTDPVLVTDGTDRSDSTDGSDRVDRIEPVN